MPRLKLLVTADGKFVLVSPEPVSDEKAESIHQTWQQAHREGDLAIIPDCEVIILTRGPDR